jgi:hypothetical protein
MTMVLKKQAAPFGGVDLAYARAQSATDTNPSTTAGGKFI